MPVNDDKFKFEGVTFDDVLLLPAYSQVLPRDTDISTRLTRTIRINTPIVSAAMDTVTESVLAIAMAREGGVGILHKNMRIDKQAEEVRKVKRSESGLIIDPITLHKDALISHALSLMKEFKIGGIPVVDAENNLVGILTNRDLRFEKDHSRPVNEVMTKENLITAPEGTDLKKAEVILKDYKIEKLPVVSKKGKLVGLITYKDILKLKNFPRSCKDKYGRLIVGAAVGVTHDTIARVTALINNGVDVICIDTAHGHSKGVIDMVKQIKKKFDIQLIGGNIGTGEGAKALVAAGADAVKVGVGPGSICTTRVVTGAGVPQLTAVYEAYKAIKNSGVPIIADGGIRYTGDVVKAIADGRRYGYGGFNVCGNRGIARRDHHF